MPFTIQFTLVSKAPLTVAVNCRVFPERTEATVGAMDTVTDEVATCATVVTSQPNIRNVKAMYFVHLTRIVSSRFQPCERE